MFIVAQILLVAHQDYGNVGAEMLDLRGPFLRNVLCGVREVRGQSECQREASVSAVSGRLTQAVGAVDGEAHEDDVGVGVRERPQPVVVLLTRRVPQR